MPSVGLFLLMVLASVLGFFAFPYAAMMMYVWLDHTAPQPQLYGPLSVIPYSQIIAIAAAVGWMITVRKKFEAMNALIALILVYAVWVSITTFFALVPEGAIWKWDRSIKVLLSTVLIGFMLTSKERIAGLFWTLTISIGVYIFRGAIRTIATGGGGGDLILGLDGTFVGERNTFATTVAGILPIIYALIRYPMLLPSTKYLRLGLWCAFALACIAIVGTHSRSGMLALGLVLAMLVWTFSRFRVVATAAAVSLSLLMIPFLPDEVINRMQSIGQYEQDGSSTNRIDAWKFGTNIAINSPIIGGGFKVFLLNKTTAEMNSADGYIDAHSFFFEILGEHGFVGLGIFLSLWFYAAYQCLKTSRQRTFSTQNSTTTEWHSVYSRCLLIALCGYTLGGLFNALGSYAFFYLVFVAIGATSLLARRTVRATKTRNLPPPRSQNGQLLKSTKQEVNV